MLIISVASAITVVQRIRFIRAGLAAAEQTAVAEWDPYSNPTISESAGTITFEDIIPGVTASEQFDELTGQTRLMINEHISSEYKPTIVLAIQDGELIRYQVERKPQF